MPHRSLDATGRSQFGTVGSVPGFDARKSAASARGDVADAGVRREGTSVIVGRHSEHEVDATVAELVAYDASAAGSNVHAAEAAPIEQSLAAPAALLPVNSRRFVMAWIYLIVAGLFEISWAIGLKYTEGFTRLLPSLGTIASMILSIVLLGLALKTLPVGTAYAVWTGIGAVGTAALGIYLFAEPATALRLICIGLILSGIVGLKLVT
jgi:quaternary ammonium compound-resistance protein SugE